MPSRSMSAHRSDGAAAGSERAPGCVVMCAAAVTSHLHLVRAMISDGHAGAVIDEVAASPLIGVDRLFARLPAIPAEEPAAATWSSARRLADQLEGHAVVGLSSFRSDPAELEEARIEAELVLAVLMRLDDPTPEDVNSGTYRLLFRMMASDQRVLHDFCESTVGVLRRYDERRRGALVQTLRTYLEEANCNMNATATAMYTHRHTVAYRLERTRALTGLDPGQPADREQLGLGLKIQLILDATSSPEAPADSRLSRQCRVSDQRDRQVA
jgi:DNA-binding PucR family transcriptional regulator